MQSHSDAKPYIRPGDTLRVELAPVARSGRRTAIRSIATVIFPFRSSVHLERFELVALD